MFHGGWGVVNASVSWEIGSSGCGFLCIVGDDK